MEKEKTELKGARELRRKAEERLKEKPAVSEKMSELETQELVQELRVYQTELEMQNEELRRTQAVLEESRAKYSDLYDFAPVGYLTLNRQGMILEANLTACSSLGKERSFLINTNSLFANFIIKKVEKDLFYQHLGKIFEAKSLETCELELKGRDNTKFYAQLESVVVKDNLSQCRTAMADITDRKRREEELRKILQQLEGTKQALDQFAVVAETDAKGKITYANDQFCEISKYSREELIGKDHRDVANSGYHSKEFWQNFWATIQAGKIWRGDVRNKTKDGSFYWQDSTVVPFVGIDGKPEKYLMVRTNITNRKKVETELRNSNLKLEELLAVKESFINNVSHELRTPVTVIREGVSLLLDGVTGPLGEEQIKYLRLVDRNCQRLTEFVSDVLDLSKIRAGRMRFLRGKIKLWGLIENVLKESQAMTDKRIVTLSASGGEGADIRAVLGDTGNIRQVLTNLLSNAVKFTKGDGTITFSIREEGEFAAVTVRDDGVGIAKEDIPKLFQEFSQVGEYQAGGTGLGLALCKNIIERHKGTILVSSEPGKGTAFTFTLPFYTPEAALEESFKDLVEEAAKNSGSPTVALIAVDCENLIRMEALEALEQLLRPQVKNGDVVIGFEPKWLILLAVTDARGVRAMSRQIRRVFEEWAGGRPGARADEAVSLTIGSAFYPVDGTDAHKLFSIAQDFARPVPLEKIKKMRILLAEDDPSVLQVTKLRLEQLGYDVLTAATGEEVLNYFRDHEAPDLLLMDMKMPKLDGLQVTAKLKVMPRAQKTPIVAFTAYGEELRKKCLEMGIFHIVKKPFGAEELLEKIRQALEEKA